MTPIDKFSLHSREGMSGERALKSSLYFDGADTRLRVAGWLIERQFELADYYMLLNSWDCPFEEGCELLIISKDWNLVGSYSFQPFYNSLLLTDIKMLSANRYELVFNDSERFELSVNYPRQGLLSKVIKVTRAED
ncbi:hypothetical protein L2725_02790 [Shewanella corallii]|uniref:Uncharacterized protein n=1 Tax=Shewanella corallii TaxID=560080 RepID=A0ABT0N2P9_9GAMM|nr:hypothetical protein [Shewanella corallii]